MEVEWARVIDTGRWERHWTESLSHMWGWFFPSHNQKSLPLQLITRQMYCDTALRVRVHCTHRILGGISFNMATHDAVSNSEKRHNLPDWYLIVEGGMRVNLDGEGGYARITSHRVYVAPWQWPPPCLLTGDWRMIFSSQQLHFPHFSSKEIYFDTVYNVDDNAM